MNEINHEALAEPTHPPSRIMRVSVLASLAMMGLGSNPGVILDRPVPYVPKGEKYPGQSTAHLQGANRPEDGEPRRVTRQMRRWLAREEKKKAGTV